MFHVHVVISWVGLAPNVCVSVFQVKIDTKPDLKVIKLEYILRLKIKRNDWLIADTCPQAANHYALF